MLCDAVGNDDDVNVCLFLQVGAGMAMIDGRPAQYGVTLKQLRELMEHRGREGVQKVNEYGGVQELCKKLYTHPNEGEFVLLLNYIVVGL